MIKSYNIWTSAFYQIFISIVYDKTPVQQLI